MKINLTNSLDLSSSSNLATFYGQGIVQTNLTKEIEELVTEKELTKFGALAATRIGKEVKNLVIASLGDKKELTQEEIRVLISRVYRSTVVDKANVVNIDLRTLSGKSDLYNTVFSAVESLHLTNYSFDKYKKEKNEKTVVFNLVIDGDIAKAESAQKEAAIVAIATINTRNIVNEPPNILYPQTLAEFAQEKGKECGFKVKILGETEAAKLGMNAFLAVGRASVHESKIIVMEYCGDPSKEKIGLVGKGVTYDTGGLSIKSPYKYMLGMKKDMGGAGAVIGAISAIAQNKLPVNVVGVIATCENAISGDAYKPDDILTSMSGKTIEVQNTDAEGRLTLADAVYYAIHEEKATKIIDLATLTGAVIVALGYLRTGAVTNSDEFYKQYEDASKISGEKVWLLPNDPEYAEILNSSVADIRNISESAGTVCAGLFIKEFVGDIPWLHLDIAGTAENQSTKDYQQKGASGVGVRTLYQMFKAMK